VDTVIDRLLSQSYLFDDPSAYEAGVRDAFDVLAAPLDAEDQRRIVEAMQAHPSAGPSQRLRAVRSHSAA
jgi:hypothetical protein